MQRREGGEIAWRSLAGRLLILVSRKKLLPEDFMSKSTHPLWPLAVLALFAGIVFSGVQLSAQQPSQQPGMQPSQQQPSPSPDDSQAQASPDSVQTFTGTVMKVGDKYVLQDASGKTYDLDNQDLVKSYEGKQVRVKGTLDPDGKTIHIK
jgi:Protein of unknown function (DUF5818)